MKAIYKETNLQKLKDHLPHRNLQQKLKGHLPHRNLQSSTHLTMNFTLSTSFVIHLILIELHTITISYLKTNCMPHNPSSFSVSFHLGRFSPDNKIQYKCTNVDQNRNFCPFTSLVNISARFMLPSTFPISIVHHLLSSNENLMKWYLK